MRDNEILIELPSEGVFIEYQYDYKSRRLFSSLFDDSGMLMERSVVKRLTNPIPLMRDRIERVIDGTLESLD